MFVCARAQLVGGLLINRPPGLSSQAYTLTYMPFRPRMAGVSQYNYFCRFIFSRETFLRYPYPNKAVVIDRAISVYGISFVVPFLIAKITFNSTGSMSQSRVTIVAYK